MQLSRVQKGLGTSQDNFRAPTVPVSGTGRGRRRPVHMIKPGPTIDLVLPTPGFGLLGGPATAGPLALLGEALV
eukprot:6883561-Pyramimonas_sp.AAC.1